MSFHLRVEKDEYSGETGRRTFWVRIVEKDGSGNVIDQGPLGGFGVSENRIDS